MERDGLTDPRSAVLVVRASARIRVGEYAGDGTIDPSVLGGGGGDISPRKMDGYSSSPAGRCADLSRAMEEDYRMDDEEEEDVMGLLFATNGSDDDFVPPSVRDGQG